MKASLLLLLASLAINVVLGALIVRRVPTSAPPATTPASASAAPAQAPASASVAAPTAASPANPATPANRDPLWAGLQVDSYDEVIARLRAAGCPPRQIAAVIRAMIQAWTMERREAFGYANESQPYWKSSQFFAGPRSDNEMSKVWIEAQRLERTYLLTPEFFGTDESELRSYRERFGALDTEKLRRLALLDSEHNEKLQTLFTSRSSQAGSATFNADPAQQEKLQAEREAAIQALLTPEEYARYEVRNGPVSFGLRYQLENFRPTEAEYLALYAIEKSRRQSSDPGTLTPQQRQEASDSYQAALKAALTPERYADFEAVRRAGSDLLPRLINRLNLPLTTLPAVTAVRDDTNARAKAIRDNATLSAEQRSAQLIALAAEAEADLRTLFVTPRGLDAYKDMKGEWLRNLRPTP